MSPETRKTWEGITTYLLRVGIFLLSIIFTLALAMFNDTRAHVKNINDNVNILLQHRAGDVKDIENLKNTDIELKQDIKRLDAYHLLHKNK